MPGRDACGFAFGLPLRVGAGMVFGGAVGGWHVPPQLYLRAQFGGAARWAGGVGGGAVGHLGEPLMCLLVGLVGAAGRVGAVELGVQPAQFGGNLAVVGSKAAWLVPGGVLAGPPGGVQGGRAVGLWDNP